MNVTMSTASGHISSKIIPQLLNEGVNVTVISRHPEKIQDLKRRGVKIVEGSLEDPKVVQRACKDADVLFWMTPQKLDAEDVDSYMQQLAHNAVKAIDTNKVKRVVNLSSLGAEQHSGLGLVSGLGEVEEILNGSTAAITHFRPAMFMENFETQIPNIAAEGKIYMAFDGGKPVPQIATEDIADAMVNRILDRDWTGRQVQELHGAEDISFRDSARIIGQELGRELQYVEVSPDEMRRELLQHGASPSMSEKYLEMFDGINHGRSKRLMARTPQSTTQTRFADFARERFVPSLRDRRIM